jgi:uncharacterized protein YndB with AHSA1/START domain
MKMATDAGAERKDFVMSRVFDAPRELVWKAFTDVEHLKHWWGPKGFTVVKAQMDLRPGGIYHYAIKSPDGKTMWGKFVYRAIEPPSKLDFVNSFSDENGGITRHPLQATWPLEMLSTFTFDDLGNGKTRFTVRWATYKATEEEQKTFDSPQMRDGMTQGWGGTMDQLGAYLAKAK